EVLFRYPFPGNVRELENIVERAAALTDDAEIGLADLPSDLRELSMSSVERQSWPSLDEKTREYLQQVLALTEGRKSEAAEILGVPRTTLWRMIKRFGLN
ncbi:MAG: helix-turn-helix domain-containing protein, partial [Holophagae bacterium]